MPFSAGPFVTASSRPLRLRMRTDLVATPQGGRDRRYWAVEDPVSLRFFHLADEEFSILRLLDGQISLDELRDRFEAAFPPQRLSASRLRPAARRDAGIAARMQAFAQWSAASSLRATRSR